MIRGHGNSADLPRIAASLNACVLW